MGSQNSDNGGFEKLYEGNGLDPATLLPTGKHDGKTDQRPSGLIHLESETREAFHRLLDWIKEQLRRRDDTYRDRIRELEARVLELEREAQREKESRDQAVVLYQEKAEARVGALEKRLNWFGRAFVGASFCGCLMFGSLGLDYLLVGRETNHAELEQLKKRVDEAAAAHQDAADHIKSFMVALNEARGITAKLTDGYKYAVTLLQHYDKEEGKALKKEIEQLTEKYEKLNEKFPEEHAK